MGEKKGYGKRWEVTVGMEKHTHKHTKSAGLFVYAGRVLRRTGWQGCVGGSLRVGQVGRFGCWQVEAGWGAQKDKTTDLKMTQTGLCTADEE